MNRERIVDQVRRPQSGARCCASSRRIDCPFQDAARWRSPAAESGSDAGADAGGRRLQRLVRPGYWIEKVPLISQSSWVCAGTHGWPFPRTSRSFSLVCSASSSVNGRGMLVEIRAALMRSIAETRSSIATVGRLLTATRTAASMTAFLISRPQISSKRSAKIWMSTLGSRGSFGTRCRHQISRRHSISGIGKRIC